MQPNKYQKDIYQTAETKDCDLLIEAGPGSGKTTCLINISKLLPKKQSILFLAFNKSIVNELKEKLPDSIDCFTFHSLGMKMLRNHYRQKLKVNQYKNLNYIKEYYDNGKEDMDKWFVVNDILNFGRIELIDFKDFEQIESICEKYDLLASQVEKTNAQLIFKQLQRYNKPKRRDEREIDFVDMIYLPLVLKNFEWFKYDNVLVDEAQDLTKAQHKFFNNLVGKRFFVVGDGKQSIYLFAGSDSNAFHEIKNFKNILSLPLSICYRCGTEIVKNAQRVYPDIEYYEENPPGEVREGEISEIEEGDMVICRNVKPLISLYFYLITLGKKSNIKGKDLEKNLIRLLKPHKNLDCDSGIAKLKEQLGELEEQLIEKGVQEPKEHYKYQSFKEKISVVETIAENFYYIYGVIEKIEEIFHEDKKAIQLMTIHKAKGLESDRVFYLHQYNGLDLVPSPFAKTEEQKIQEKNLEFVALTRAKNELIYLSYNDE